MFATRRSLIRLGCALALALGMGLTAGCASAPPPTPNELGEAALAQNDWRAALTHFARALELDARDGRALQGQAASQLRGRDPEAALDTLGRLSKLDPERFRFEARPLYADALEAATARRLERKQSQAALVAARALAGLEPRRNGLPRLIGRALLDEADRLRLRGDAKSALALYQEARRVTPGVLEAWIGAAEILIENRQGKQAIRLLEAAREFHPTAGAIRVLTLQALRVR